jgi:hypothetical protein
LLALAAGSCKQATKNQMASDENVSSPEETEIQTSLKADSTILDANFLSNYPHAEACIINDWL